MLWYKFAPDLIMLDAYETVESWMTRKELNPRKLIPAMMSYSSEPQSRMKPMKSSSIYNTAKGRSNCPDFFYYQKYALCLCLKEIRIRACVHIYGMMFMHEEFVALAFQVYHELAMAEADKVEDDEESQKKLWLMVAKHVVE
nr:vacuolar protein sorting-associated protein 18 homolog [Tanacetum cinerariifolium]